MELTAPTEGQMRQLLHYAALLQAQNQVMNLTAITAPAAVAELHFLDSAALLAEGLPAGASLIDVGSGAGFPGVVLKILRPDLRLCLLDSLDKRVRWLESLCAALELSEVRCVHGRGELLGRDPAFREQFDFATARAVAALPLLAELCLPFVRPGGRFLAMKAQQAGEELDAARPILQTLGGAAPSLRHYRLPFSGAERALICVSKAEPTPDAYPRTWAKMKKDAR